MRIDLLIVTLAVGVGTWLFRFLPTRLRSGSAIRSPRLARAMESIGPAAITTLFIASLLPELAPGAPDRGLILIGSGATFLAFQMTRNVVVATIAGTVAYGLAFAGLG